MMLAVITAVFLGSHRWPVFAGLFSGALLGFFRLCGNEWIFKRLLCQNGAKAAAGGAAVFLTSQLLLILALALAYEAGRWAFCGLLAGVLIIPAVVMMNSITEAVGFTKNSFE